MIHNVVISNNNAQLLDFIVYQGIFVLATILESPTYN